MHYQVRPMNTDDIAQAVRLEREAFPSQWPTTSFRHELQNKLARYLVVCDGLRNESQTAPIAAPVPEERAARPGRLVSRIKNLFGRGMDFIDTDSPGVVQPILGMVGYWLMFDEAHITTIAVWEHLRRQGLGELLLASTFDMAMEQHAKVVTLEVRVSNTAAQALYEKYGFMNVGTRRAYYTDNKEDAFIMTTVELTSEPFLSQYRHLKHLCMERLEG